MDLNVPIADAYSKNTGIPQCKIANNIIAINPNMWYSRLEMIKQDVV